MGKVTIVVESKDMSTTQLYAMLMANNNVSEEGLKDFAAQTVARPEDLRVYVVPGDD